MPRVDIDNQPLFYRLSANDLTGRRPPLLLIHGAGGTHMHWPASLRRLPGWNVYAIDLPGHGKSAGPGRASMSSNKFSMAGLPAFCRRDSCSCWRRSCLASGTP